MDQMILDYSNREPIYIQIYNHFKEEIINRNLQKGEKLPSIRELSADINVSKTTIETAYNQLVVEGYVNNVPKSGYYVVEIKDYLFPETKKSVKQDQIVQSRDYINNGVDKKSFDIKVWKRIYGNVLLEQENELYTSGDEQGELVLRENICRFVQKTRGVHCTSSQIVIGAGMQSLLGILCSLLKTKYRNVAMESPGFTHAKSTFEDYSMNIIPIGVSEEGIDIDILKKSNAKMVFLSPSHQYPTGSVMPIDKRLEVLNWAKEKDALILEDDYDCLIRYESRPIPALQGLDSTGHVIYFGSFSKILLPSIRISYMILPQSILELYTSYKRQFSQSSSKMEQLALAQFMEEGYLKKHLRKIKKIYYRKNELIVNFIKKNARNKINILGHDSGLHMMFEITTNKEVSEILKDAESQNIHLELVEGFQKDKLVVVFTYSGLEEDVIEKTLDLLMKKVF
ncbi:GntR family transcriptional regulator/MocR family aminotransferase [Alkalibaculum bacchi]|uniref:GntR family transcriptional regulator/MocR family aminotransferase n=1 Tax=Alkalibaculum bacchi TaxID=645887 RepID=A0A366HXZ6_9FIRM|nr:PLP-dependent aminotransferase family protein [Alkalibaculum bacchi]RBP58723.1 GntR family transcriptional regulator/MocR family aminotransferase [Alkalibaculum bacchi]